jgi:ion channel POLLUX/CASTOR
VLFRSVCRSGNPLDVDDLKIVSLETSRAIIIVSPGGQYPDMPSIKTLMALTKDRAAREKPYHIVTTVRRPVNLDLARMIGGDETQVFMVDRLIAHVIAQTCRQPGLSVVYSELFSFQGSAIYFFAEPALAGLTYGDALLRCEQAVPIGLHFQNGETRLNPPMNTVLQAGDQIIAIAARGGSLSLLEPAQVSVDSAAIRTNASQPKERPPERLLILGWNRRGAMILEQLDQYVAAGSQARVVAPFDLQQMQTDCAGLNFEQLFVTFEMGNVTDRKSLEKLEVESYQYIIVLNPMEVVDAQLADAMTVVSLLYLRNIARQAGRSFSIVSEILDERNRDLAEITSAEDMIISERLIALALTQLAVNKDVMPVFTDLLTTGGPEIYLKPAGDYVHPGQPVNFYTLLAAAHRKGETAIGYRLLAEASDEARAFGVHLNPLKGEPVVLGEGDRLIVLADMGD